MKASQLRKTALKRQNQDNKKAAISQYRKLKKTIKKAAKNGHLKIEWSFYFWSPTGKAMLTAARLLSFKHKDLIVNITPKKEDPEDSFYDCDNVRLSIKWNN